MLSIFLIIIVVSVMVKVASAEDRSTFLWGFITTVLCVACSFIPIPFVGIALGGVISYGIMFFLNMRR